MKIQEHEQENSTASTPKGAKLKRLLLRAIEVIMFFAAGMAIGSLLESRVLMLIAIIPVGGAILLLFHWLRTKKLSHLYEKPEENQADELEEESATPQPPPPKQNVIFGYFCMALQLGAGGILGFSTVSLIIRFIDGYDGGFGLYFGLLGLAVAIFVISIVLSVVNNAAIRKDFAEEFTSVKNEFAAVKKEIIFSETDERMRVISHKAGYITLWTVLTALMLFGGAVVALPIENVNILTVGFLGICVLGVVVYASVMGYYSEKDFSSTSKVSIPLKVTFFALSLVPLALMGLQWGINGLSTAGIAFFIAFAITSAALLVEAVAQAKIKKTRGG